MNGFDRRALGLTCAALAVVYFAAGKFGLTLAFVNASATAVWPPAGIAVAALLLLGNQVWPAILLGAFLVNLTTTGTVASSGGIAVGNLLEGLLGAYLVRRFANGRHAFERPHDVFKFAALAAVAGPALAATVGVTTLFLTGLATRTDFGGIWLTWWLGDAGGVLIVAPLLILWGTRPLRPWSSARGLEVALMSLSLLLTALALFGGFLDVSINSYPLEFLVFPTLVWVAFRFGPRETAAAIWLLSGIAIWGTLHGFGPFAGATQNAALLLVQAFMALTAIPSLVLAAAVRDRQRAEESIRATEALQRRTEHARLLQEQVSRAEAEQTRQRLRFLADASVQVALLDLVPTAVIVRDLTGVIRSWNPAAEHLYGWTAAEARSQVAHRLLRTRFPEELTAIDAALIREGHWEGELVHLHRNGAEVVVASCQALHRDESDQSSVILELNTDITDRKRIEAERLRLFRDIEATEAKFRGLLESAPDGVVILGQDGRIALINRQTEALFGYTRHELLGQPVEVLIPRRYGAAHVSHRANYFALPQTRPMGAGLELFGRRKDGTEFPAEISLSSDYIGDQLLVSSTIRDITVRKQTEQALRESDEWFRLLVDGIKDYAIYRLTLDGHVATWNTGAERLNGYGAEEIIGQHFSRFYADEDVQSGKPQRQLREAAAAGRFEDEGWRVRKDGSRFWANIVMTALYDETGQPRGFAKVTRDVTELHGRLEAFERERLLENERHRIATELHDRVEQTFFGIGLTARGALDQADHLAEPFRVSLATVRAFAEEGTEQLREAIFALSRPDGLDRGLVPSLWGLVRDFRRRACMEADLVVSGSERPVSPETAETLYAVASEALANVERHAAASAVVLSLWFEPGTALLSVQDDGAGVSPLVLRTLANSATHFGLRGLRERVDRLGGTFTAQPGEDGGFVVRALVPLQATVPQ